MDVFGYSCVVFLLISLGCRTVFSTYSTTGAQALYTQLITTNSYNSLLRPSASVSVNIAFTLLSVNYLDVKDQKFSVNGFLTVDWTDSRFVWTPASYNDIQSMYFTDTNCWTPELVIDNSVNDIALIQDDNLLLKAHNNGDVEWRPPGVYTVNCDVDITYYPFDSQDCSIRLTSWSYDMSVLVLNLNSADIDFSDYTENGEWTLTNVYKARVEATNAKNSLQYAFLEFHFVMERKSTYYVLNVILPLIIISFLGSMVFLLPAESGEKIGFSVTVLLAQAVLLTIISATIPTTSKNTSLLGVFLAANLIISTLETLMAVVALSIHHKEDKKVKMSKRFRKFVKKILARLTFHRKCCCCKDSRASHTEESLENVEVPQKNGKRKTSPIRKSKVAPEQWEITDTKYKKEFSWIQVAEMVDTMSLMVLLFVKFVLTVVFLLVLALRT